MMSGSMSGLSSWIDFLQLKEIRSNSNAKSNTDSCHSLGLEPLTFLSFSPLQSCSEIPSNIGNSNTLSQFVSDLNLQPFLNSAPNDSYNNNRQLLCENENNNNNLHSTSNVFQHHHPFPSPKQENLQRSMQQTFTPTIQNNMTLPLVNSFEDNNSPYNIRDQNLFTNDKDNKLDTICYDRNNNMVMAQQNNQPLSFVMTSVDSSLQDSRRKTDIEYLFDTTHLPIEYQYKYDAQLKVAVDDKNDPTGRTTAEFLCSYPSVSWNTRMQSWLVYYEDMAARRSKTFNPKRFTPDRLSDDPRWEFLREMDALQIAMHCACAFAADVRYKARLYKAAGLKIARFSKRKNRVKNRSLSSSSSSSISPTQCFSDTCISSTITNPSLPINGVIHTSLSATVPSLKLSDLQQSLENRCTKLNRTNVLLDSFEHNCHIQSHPTSPLVEVHSQLLPQSVFSPINSTAENDQYYLPPRKRHNYEMCLENLQKGTSN